MALYRLEAKIISRKYPVKTRGKNRGKEIKKTRSAVAASAYRTGKNLYDERRGKMCPYQNRSKDVKASVILAPAGAPDWVFNSEKLWNKVEAAEKRKDAQLSRELILAVPPELTHEEQFQFTVDWLNKELVSRGMIVEASLHHLESSLNDHIHVQATMRKLDGDKFNAKKSREWNEKALLRHWRKSWCEAENAALEKAGRPERVDHRSLKDRGIDRIPQPKIGKEATALKRRGIVADPERYQLVRFVKSMNEVRPWQRALKRFDQFKIEGTGRTWWERSLMLMSQVRHAARETVADTWQMLLASRSRGPSMGPGMQHGPGPAPRGPDMSR